mmetsp:Transcript_40565/g.127879  ORF Transcript_40565/g.127879 Transcript_40565/m.127879 type:complete len:210 (-) Transcript_40565:86-715(-)
MGEAPSSSMPLYSPMPPCTRTKRARHRSFSLTTTSPGSYCLNAQSDMSTAIWLSVKDSKNSASFISSSISRTRCISSRVSSSSDLPLLSFFANRSSSSVYLRRSANVVPLRLSMSRCICSSLLRVLAEFRLILDRIRSLRLPELPRLSACTLLSSSSSSLADSAASADISSLGLLSPLDAWRCTKELSRPTGAGLLRCNEEIITTAMLS